MIWIVILVLGLAAGTIGGVVGFGSSVILMPVLVLAFGPKEAVPLMALSALLANLSRATVWWRDIDWKVNAAYCAPAIPAAMLGARTLLTLDARYVEAALGAFFVLMIPLRRWLVAHGFTIGLAGIALVGAGIGFLTGLVATTGPINTPFFLAYGLTKGAYLSTEAVGSAAISMTKLAVFRKFDALPTETLLRGLLIGSSVMVGSWLAKRIVLRMDASQFRLLLEVMMLIAGVVMIAQAVR